MTESAAKDKKLQGNPLAGLATALAPMMVNYVVDNTVTPSGISALIADSKSAMKKTRFRNRGSTHEESSGLGRSFITAFFYRPQSIYG